MQHFQKLLCCELAIKGLDLMPINDGWELHTSRHLPQRDIPPTKVASPKLTTAGPVNLFPTIVNLSGIGTPGPETTNWTTRNDFSIGILHYYNRNNKRGRELKTRRASFDS
jgi:hypothetical protein